MRPVGDWCPIKFAHAWKAVGETGNQVPDPHGKHNGLLATKNGRIPQGYKNVQSRLWVLAGEMYSGKRVIV